MSTTTVSLSDLTAEQLAFLNDTPQDVSFGAATFTSTFAKLIFKLCEDEQRAKRADCCGQWCRLRDAAGHTVEEVHFCSLPFCAPCALRRSERYLKSWNETLQNEMASMRHLDTAHLVYLRVSIPRPERSLADAKLIMQRYGAIDVGLYHWTSLVKYEGNNLILKMLLVNTTSMDPNSWALLFPSDAKVEVQTQSMSRLAYYFQYHLLVPETPKSPQDCAEQEVLFSGMRRLRNYGINLPKEAPEWAEGELFVQEVDLTNNSAEEVAEIERRLTELPVDPPETVPNTAPRRRCCQVCGLPFIEVSQIFHADEPTPPESALRWYKIG